MDEQEFDWLFPPRPFGTTEAMQAEARLRRCGMLGLALWGRTSDYLRRQLLAPYPEIPSGFDLEDFRELQRFAQLISSGLASSRNAGLPPFPLATSSPAIFVRTQQFTPWEGCCEVLRRAIEHLEKGWESKTLDCGFVPDWIKANIGGWLISLATSQTKPSSSPYAYWVRFTDVCEARSRRQELDKEMRVSQTANLGIVDNMHSENTYARYLLDLGRLLKEEAMQARQQAKGAPDDDRLFQEGRLLAYHEIVSLMQQQAIAFGLPLDSIGLQGIDPDADLV